MIHDITLPISEDLAVWPGDTPFRRVWQSRMEDGNCVNLSALQCSLHLGTHVDAPLHFEHQGVSADRMDLSHFVGPATVLDVSGAEEIRVSALGRHAFHPRLLLRTGAWQDRTAFPTALPSIHPEVPRYLGERGVVLLGVDIPSVDPLDSQDLANHRALHASGIAILESALLDDVAPGDYHLVALPLRIAGADGSPVRAILIR